MGDGSGTAVAHFRVNNIDRSFLLQRQAGCGRRGREGYFLAEGLRMTSRVTDG